MRCLLVEDEPDRVARILPELKAIFGDANVDIAGDRDAAMSIVEKTAFDLIVLDQRIPTGPGQLDADVIHGRAVLDHVRQMAPDTPVYFLTGLPLEDEYVDHLMAEGTKCDVWGDRKPVPLILRFQKATLAPFYKVASEIAATARVTDEIEINTRGAGIALNSDEARLLRSFTRLHGGVCVDIGILNDGLSGARVMRADVKDAQGGIRISAVSKLGLYDSIMSEIERYEREVVRLPPGTYAPLIPGQVARVINCKGAFYRLLDGYDQSLFDVLRRSDANAALCVGALREGQAPWARNPTVRKMRIGDLVKLLIWENRLPAIHALLDGIGWERYEDREISINLCVRHGDLHGENVLINGEFRVMLIDYGAVDPLPSAIDAVTLELSPFFHPHGLRDALHWAPGQGDIDWFDRDAFCAISGVPIYIRAAREWAHGDGFGDREVLACAYTYLARQLQFPNAEKDLIRAMIAGIVRRGMQV